MPVLITGTLLYKRSSAAIHEKIQFYSSEILNQISQNIDRELARLEYDSIEIMFSQEVQNTLTYYDVLSEWELLDVSEQLQERLVTKFSFLHDVSDVIVYTGKQQKLLAYGDTGSNILNYNEGLLQHMFDKAMELNGVPYWISTNIDDEVHKVDLIVNKDDTRDGIVLVRQIKSLETGEGIGTFLMRTNESYLTEIYEDIDVSKQKILIINSQGIVMSSNEPSWLVGERFVNPSFIGALKYNEENSVQGFRFNLDQEYLAFYQKSEKADWYIVGFTPVVYLFEETYDILRYTLFVGFISILIAILASVAISRSIFVPMSRINRKMKRVQSGELDVRIEDSGNDELTDVGRHFNDMIDEVKELILRTKVQEKEKRIAELSALQAQINPHFLSNTLNSVKWLANVQGAENIESLTTSLISLLHVAMGKEDDFISLSQEVAYLEDYLNIQSYRYLDKFQTHMEIDDDVKAAMVPRFMIQPLVENVVYITVTDNGKGMSKENIRKVMEEKNNSKSTFSGIGLSNVRERIKMYFGDPCAVTIESLEGVFTRIEVVFPYLEKGDYDLKFRQNL